jgi:hypothetical protein
MFRDYCQDVYDKLGLVTDVSHTEMSLWVLRFLQQCGWGSHSVRYDNGNLRNIFLSCQKKCWALEFTFNYLLSWTYWYKLTTLMMGKLSICHLWVGCCPIVEGIQRTGSTGMLSWERYGWMWLCRLYLIRTTEILFTIVHKSLLKWQAAFYTL